jgi:hypothetical protein
MARATLHDFYVYVIFRPDGTPCYVGKGRRNRWVVHALKTKNTNRHLGAIYAAAGGVLPIVKVREGLTDIQALETEVTLIKAIGRQRHGGPLVNFTDGGEGHAGYEQSIELRQRRSIWMQGNTNRGAGHTSWMKDRTHPPEVIEIISAKRKGHPTHTKPHTEETKRKISVAKSGVKQGPRNAEWCASLSKAMTGKPKSVGHRRNLSIARRAFYRNVPGQGDLEGI